MAWLIRSLAGFAQSSTGITITPLRAMGVATVLGCWRITAETIASLPLEVRMMNANENRPAPEHRLYDRLRLRPNAEMSSMDARAAMQVNLSSTSTAYAEVLRDLDRDAIGFYPIETARMDQRRDPKTKKLYYRLIDTGARFELEDILHLKSNSFNGVTGINVTSAARECIALALALQDNAARFFGNGSRPSGVLEHPASLSAEAQKRLKEQIESSTGRDGAYNLLLLEEGLKFAKERSENTDSQFVESRDRQDLDICRVYGVPPHKLGISVGARTGGSVEEDNLSFVSDRIRPLCEQYEQEYEWKLLTGDERDQGYRIRHDLDALLRGNRQARYASYAIGRQWTILTQNNCRIAEGLPPLPDGNVTLQPINMIDSTKATEYLMAQKKPDDSKKEKPANDDDQE